MGFSDGRHPNTIREVRGDSRELRESGQSKGEVVGGKTKEVPQWVVKNCQPGQSVERRGINPRECLSDRDLGEWIKDIGVTIAPLVPQGYRYLVLRGLWTGGDLDAQELHQIPVAGLIQQRVQVREGCVPYAARTRRRPSQYAEEWRKQYVSEGITCGISRFLRRDPPAIMACPPARVVPRVGGIFGLTVRTRTNLQGGWDICLLLERVDKLIGGQTHTDKTGVRGVLRALQI